MPRVKRSRLAEAAPDLLAEEPGGRTVLDKRRKNGLREAIEQGLYAAIATAKSISRDRKASPEMRLRATEALIGIAAKALAVKPAKADVAAPVEEEAAVLEPLPEEDLPKAPPMPSLRSQEREGVQ